MRPVAASCSNYFNPRSREGSDVNWCDATFRRMLFQSTLPRGERPSHQLHITKHGISIHAPARGATVINSGPASPAIFQSTLPRGERRGTERNIVADVNFNPRSREGSDSRLFRQALCPLFQSTLPRGERRQYLLYCSPNIHFNPRSREGSDERNPSSPVSSCYFNPRSREGSDPVLLQRQASVEFQSTLPRGERHFLPPSLSKRSIFQSTLPRGERLLRLRRQREADVFQSTLPRGERQQFYLKFTLCF